jgi:hypothetical protein
MEVPDEGKEGEGEGSTGRVDTRGGGGGAGMDGSAVLPAKISELGDYHCGVVHAVEPVPELGEVVASVGEDGYLRVWDTQAKVTTCAVLLRDSVCLCVYVYM